MLNVLLFIQVIFAIFLIVVVAMQTSKNEGLGGAISGQTSSSFRGKLGREEQLGIVTKYIAVAFFILSIIVAIVASKAA